MISDGNKNIVLAFLPVMNELELMGHNPIEHFMPELTVKQIERRYVATQRAAKKYPDWYEEVKKFVLSWMK